MTGTLANQAMNFLVSGLAPRRLGNAHPNIAPYEAFATADSWFILAIGNDQQFVRFCNIVGIEPPADYASNAQRLEQGATLRAVIAEATRKWKRDNLLFQLDVWSRSLMVRV